jgi:hypothetical protein
MPPEQQGKMFEDADARWKLEQSFDRAPADRRPDKSCSNFYVLGSEYVCDLKDSTGTLLAQLTTVEGTSGHHWTVNPAIELEGQAVR